MTAPDEVPKMPGSDERKGIWAAKPLPRLTSRPGARSLIVLAVVALAVAFAVALVGCTPAGPAASTATEQPAQALVSCGGLPFPPSALTDGPDPMTMSAEPYGVFGAFLRDPAQDVAWLPDEGWHVLAVSPAAVSIGRFNAQAGPDEPPALSIEVTVFQGAWKVTGWGQCRPQTVLPEGLEAGEWWLAEPARRDSTVLAALVSERHCASGKSPVGRIAPPMVDYGATAVTITIGIRPLEGGQECPGIAPTPIRIELAEPLGDRVLLDGGAFPPIDASRPRR